MPENQPHFAVLAERVRTRPVKVRGRAKPFSRPDYSAHADYLRERTAALRAYAQETADADAVESVFVQVTTPAALPVRGERQRLHSAGLDLVALSPVDPNSATAQVRRADLRALEAKVDRYGSTPKNRGKSYLSIIEDLQAVPIQEKIDPSIPVDSDDPFDCLLLFYSTLTEKERASVLLAVRSFMARTGHELGEQRRLSNGVMLVQARLRPSEAIDIGAAFTTVRQVAPNNVFIVPDSWRISSISPAVRVEPPAVSMAVAIVDTGISPTCTGLAGSVVGSCPQLPPGAVAPWPKHGTFVASRVVYGDELERGLRSGVLQPRCSVIDVPVIGIDARGSVVGLDEARLAGAIDVVLPTLPPNARVVNISLGTDSPVSDGRVSLVAQILDKHVRELDLVAVVTAGNIRDPALVRDFPRGLQAAQSRIDSPGDGLLSVTVGSIAKAVEAGALSRVQEVSPFSRRGPGPFGGVKPDVVAHGGNCKADFSTSAAIGTHGLLPDSNAWACDIGTSFAAPLVAAMAAQLFEHYVGTSANLVRALLLHFTDPALCPPIPVPPHHLHGLGEPNLERAMWSQEHAAAFLFSGEISPNTYCYVPFLVPTCLAAGAGGRLRIKATVVIDPPVDPDNQLEYGKARVTVALRKPADVGFSNVGVSANLVDADKWWPVMQLDRSFSRSYQPGEWQLQVRLWGRNLEEAFRQRFAVVIEVIDETGALPVYRETAAAIGTSFRIIVPRQAA